MPKKISDAEKLVKYNEMIQKQIVRNVKWVENNQEKYKELMSSYSKNYYEKNREELNQKRTIRRRMQRELANQEKKCPPPPENQRINSIGITFS